MLPARTTNAAARLRRAAQRFASINRHTTGKTRLTFSTHFRDDIPRFRPRCSRSLTPVGIYATADRKQPTGHKTPASNAFGSPGNSPRIAQPHHPVHHLDSRHLHPHALGR